MRPRCVIAAIAADYNPIDLTAKTGGTVNTYSINGYTGAAWMATDANGHAYRHKFASGDQLVPTLFADYGTPTNDSGGLTDGNNPAHWDYADMVGGDSESSDYQPSRAFGVNVHQADGGFRFQVAAGNDSRHMEYTLECFAPFTVTATPSDGSSPPASLALGTVGLQRFALDWCTAAPAPDAYVTVEVRSTANQFSFVRPLYAWIGVPRLPERVRGALLTTLRPFGGPNR